MFAKIIPGKLPKAMDRLLDYAVPQGMELEIGDSVIVPFGVKNTPIEGYVAGFSEKSDVLRVKNIKEKSGLGRCFDGNMLELIKWMREKYLCTYEDVLATIVPAGASFRSREWIIAEQSECDKKYEPVLRVLLQNGGAMEHTKLCAVFDKNISSKISRMVKLGILKREFVSSTSVKVKTVKAVRLCIDNNEAENLKKQFSEKKPIWSQILDILLLNEFVAVADLKLFTGSHGSEIKTLEKRGIIESFDVEVFRLPKNKYKRKEEIPTLTQEQTEALNSLNNALEKEEYSGFLLFGVTGSGKTEVFMRAIAECIKKGKQAVVLVPEISLTPQMVNRFTTRFGKSVAVLHSGLSHGERFDQWRKIRSGDIDIVIGARSAIFAPLDNIGIIIVDEEHSDTYKSEMSPRYDAREVAEFRARQSEAVLVLASATPSTEDFYKAREGVLKPLYMTRRANKSSLPDVKIVDMRKELADGNKSMISRELKVEIEKNLENGEQTILFLNRRGFSTFVSCRECGFVAQCPNCNISLTYHKYDNTLQCHYCGHTIKNYTVCPKCRSKYIRYFGGGTQKIEEEIKKIFPKSTIIRMDIDTTGKKQSHEEILKRFEEEKTDILVGTQMVTKGLDFENVTLVGVISADTMLHADDFRSSERTFGILEQVTGRAGRGKKPGRAIVQTYSPEHEAIQFANQHDYMSFFDTEIKMRELLWYPPYCQMVCIGFSGPSVNDVSDCAKDYFKLIKAAALKERIDVLGPIPSAVSKIKGKHRWQILIKCENVDRISPLLADIKNKLNANDIYKDTVIVIDKNPVHVY